MRGDKKVIGSLYFVSAIDNLYLNKIFVLPKFIFCLLISVSRSGRGNKRYFIFVLIVKVTVSFLEITQKYNNIVYINWLTTVKLHSIGQIKEGICSLVHLISMVGHFVDKHILTGDTSVSNWTSTSSCRTAAPSVYCTWKQTAIWKQFDQTFDSYRMENISQSSCSILKFRPIRL